ncbi:hypothetical protein [Litorilituus sediminis]|uniref:Uncharacterized protein n=1 Tax=Litorilituus sediminis TaxID=718192 RepID=A0A4P6P6B4_9GAMM|nr:hypothetical protein [Litorilituus sediminis]QBG34905.1 hypothetical protein EMK97_03720 [Litorilituus sediminis]
MFDRVARAGVHHQKIQNLLKQRTKVHNNLLFDKGRMATIEQQLCTHIYALTDESDEGLSLKPQVRYLLDAMTFLSQPTLTSESLIAYYTSAEQASHKQALLMLCSMLPLSLTFAEPRQYIEEMLYKTPDLAALLRLFDINWQEEQLAAARKAVLVGESEPDVALCDILFSAENISTADFTLGYQHENFTIAMASFIASLSTKTQQATANAALFQRFYKTAKASEKAQWLALAGLFGDEQWLEPCALFCQEYPDYCYEILCHYHHKTSLTVVIELMAIAQTAPAAYLAWQVITKQPLPLAAQLTDSSNKHQVAGKHSLPCVKQAELIRQALFKQPEDKILAGISFNDSNFNAKLSSYQGLLLQRVMLRAGVNKRGAEQTTKALYQQQLSYRAFSQFTQDETSIKLGAERVA